MRSEFPLQEKPKCVSLGSVCNITSSKRIFAREYKTSGIPFYRGKEIIEKHKGNSVSTELFISEERYYEIKRKFGVPQIGDILLTSVGTLGVSWLVDETDFYFKDGNLTWLKCSDKLLNKYLYLWLNSPEAQHQIDAKCIGSTQKALTIETLNKFQIALPTLSEQNRICSVLYPIIDKIELNQKINENLERQAQELFGKMFVETNNDKRHECCAGDYFDISIGKTPPRKEPQWFSNNSTDCVWVSISDMGSCGVFIADSSEYLTHEAVENFNVKLVPDNTVILSFKLTVGRVSITDGVMTTNEAIAHFKTDKPEINEYLYCYLKRFNFQTMGSTSSIATAINSKIIKSMPFIVPADSELTCFHSFAEPLFAMIKCNQRENVRLAALRDLLLPKLISGEIDVRSVSI